MKLRPAVWALGALGAVAVAACDDDPTAPTDVLTLVQCPTGPLAVNAPIMLEFTQPIDPATVRAGNVVLTSAETGVELPGSLTVQNTATGGTITFEPGETLPFGSTLRLRIHNLIAEGALATIGVTVCEVTTAPPPITELFWNQLPSPTGTRLTGASLIAEDTGFVSSASMPIFRRYGGDFTVVFNEPHFAETFDIAFVDPRRGFAAHNEPRESRSVITRTLDGGLTWDTVTTLPNQSVGRTLFRRVGTAPNDIFGVVAGGTGFSTRFHKYFPATNTFGFVSFAGSAGVEDIDVVPNDTSRLAAVTGGLRLGSFLVLGRLFTSSNGGASWAAVPGADANQTAITYQGVAYRTNGQIWIVGGSGYVLRLEPAGGGAYTVNRLDPSMFGITNPDSTNPQALIYTDVEFAPDDNQRGWIIGAVQTGVEVGGVPRYQGLIFETRDGGQTWTRQGVQGASNFGANFPRLHRLSVRTADDIWIVGDDGVVLEYRP